MSIIKFEYRNNKLNKQDFIFEKETRLDSVAYLSTQNSSGGYNYNLTEECKKKYKIDNPLQLRGKKVKVINSKYVIINNKKVIRYYTLIDYVTNVRYLINSYCKIEKIHVYTYSFMSEKLIRNTFTYFKNNSSIYSLYYYNKYLRNDFVESILLILKYCNIYFIPNELFLHIMSFISKGDFFGTSFFSIEKICMI